MPKAWMNDRKQEYYYRKAKEENYRSRATYKLFEAVKKYRFIHRNDIVVDLGAAPGGWIQAARKCVGKRGFVLGVDLKPIDPFPQEYIKTIIADITNPDIANHIQKFLPRKADVVISDSAPNISGTWDVDHARQIDLATQAFKIAIQILSPSGDFFVKVFQGSMLNDFRKTVKEHFKMIKLVKPKASLAKSSEIYILAMDKKADNELPENA